MDARLREHAQKNPSERKDLGERFMARGAFDCPIEVWDKIKKRFPELAENTPEGQKAFVKWFNSSASEYYNRFKLVDRI